MHSEEELAGSYNWDYLLDWGPQYQPLAHVFQVEYKHIHKQQQRKQFSFQEISSLKDEELDMIGELISNIYGALEVSGEIKNGASKKEALNGFMSRVLGSIDK